MKKLKSILLFKLEHLFKEPRKNYSRNKMSFVPGPELKNFLYTGLRWCSDASHRWAEIKTLELTKLIITLNLALLAFNAAAQQLFEGKRLLLASVLLSLASIILLIHFLWSVINKNLNNLNDRSFILQDALNSLDQQNLIVVATEYSQAMTTNAHDRRDHEEKYMPIQRLGVILFTLALVISVLGIILSDPETLAIFQ